MARVGQTAQEFIQSSFSPIVAVLCSPRVENVVAKNNLSLTELLQPFTSMEEGQFREPGGSACIVKNWNIIFRDVNWKPVQPTEARRQLNNAVLHNYNEKTVVLEVDGQKLDIPQSTPWFDAWREAYLDVQFPSDHEFTKHFLSCIIVGTTHDDNIVDTYNGLNQQYAQLQNVTPPKLPKWFNNDILKSYLLLHDCASVTKEKADAAFDALTQSFGKSNCFMLCINSKSTVDPCLPSDYWGPFIKRSTDGNTDMQTSFTTTPVEPQTVFVTTNVPPGTDPATVSMPQEVVHPLTADNDVYDNANSLQTHSFSGSSESVSVSGKTLDSATEIHGAALNAADIERIKRFLQDYASKALLPHIEKLIAQLSEGVATKKGVSRSLISATKRWFNTGKAGNPTVNNAVIYSSDCPELQLRRLGDLWFLCGQWQRAFDAYHAAKREFYADSAWLCYAGALEMAAVSAFMAGDASRKTHAYMEESIVTYLNTCRMVQYAVRATLLSVLCLKSSGLHGDAAKQLIRMTSEDSDLRSAMLLEQAALCFLSGPGSKCMCRKYAFHMVLAGHRFSKAGQKKHAYRCYNQAYQVYASRGWRLAADHVQFALGRLASALRECRAAEQWLRAPLAPLSPQPPPQQRAFLDEYMRAHQQWVDSSDEFKERLPLLPLPLLEHEATAVLCIGPAPLSSPGRVPATSLSLSDESSSLEDQTWHKLEEMLLQVAQGSVPMIFKPTVDLYTEKTDANPVVPQGEPIQISITLRNPLKISLVLKDVELLWQFIPNEEDPEAPKDVINNSTGNVHDTNAICGQKIKSVILEGDCRKAVNFALTPLRVGQLSIQGIAYKLFNTGEGGNESSAMISGKLDLVSGVNNADKRLNISVISHAPCLQMTFSETSADVLSGELRALDVELRNVGPVDMRNLHLAVSHPDCVSVAAARSGLDALYDEKYRPLPVFADERAARSAAWRSLAARHACSVAPLVARGGNVRARLLLRVRAAAPRLRLLAYYETGAAHRPYRLLRHVFRFNVIEAVELAITPRRSQRNVDGVVRENLNLPVEIKNVFNEKDEQVSIEILEASLLSRQWKLTHLTAARSKDDHLNAHERLHLIFKAMRILEPLSDAKVEHSKLKVSSSPEANDDVNVAPYSQFLVEYKTALTDAPEPPSKEKKIAGLIESMFVLRWKAHYKTNGKTAIGQHCLWLNCFTKAESRERHHLPVDILPALQLDDFDSKVELKENKKKNKDNIVIFRLEHSDNIIHNFSQRKLCLVPITINILNCYGVPVQVFIDMTKEENRDSHGVLGWAGALTSSPDSQANDLGVSVSLDKFESRKIQVRAVCASPGTYLVGSAFAVTASREQDLHSMAHCINNTSLLVVQQA